MLCNNLEFFVIVELPKGEVGNELVVGGFDVQT